MQGKTAQKGKGENRLSRAKQRVNQLIQIQTFLLLTVLSLQACFEVLFWENVLEFGIEVQTFIPRTLFASAKDIIGFHREI